MTVIEQRTMDAIQSINRKMRDQHQPDWEQRRYEIAKDIYVHRLMLPQDRLALTEEADAETAVEMADVLIEALKKVQKNRKNDKNICSKICTNDYKALIL